METTKNEAKVGIFVLAGIVLLSVSILLIGGDQLIFKNYYKLQIDFKETQGLNKGSVVSLAGIVVGNITEINFKEKNGDPVINVVINVEHEFKSLIKTDSLASIKTKGALGDKYVYLTVGSNNATSLVANQTIKLSSGSDVFDLISNSGSDIENVFDIVSEIKALLVSINTNNNPKLIMENIQSSTAKLDLTLAETHRFMKLLNTNASSFKKIDSILSKIDRGEGTLGALINDPVIHKKLVKLLGGNPNTSFLKPLIYDTIRSRDSTLPGNN